MEAGATADTASGPRVSGCTACLKSLSIVKLYHCYAQGWRPLHQLSSDTHSADPKAQPLKLVLQAGADVHAKDPTKGNTALHVAAVAVDKATVHLL